MVLGVIGGCGPAAGVWFLNRLVALTEAATDREHVDLLYTGRASTPDRTAYLTGKSEASPARSLTEDARSLAAGGADVLVLLCHTAHAFLPEIRASVPRPILNMPGLALAYAWRHGLAPLGVLCTEGSCIAGVFTHTARRLGLPLRYPDAASRAEVEQDIYRQIKAGAGTPCLAVERTARALTDSGCRAVLLGCTELSMLYPPSSRGGDSRLFSPPGERCLYLDPVEILARCCIRLCGKKVKEESSDAAAYASLRPSCRETATV